MTGRGYAKYYAFSLAEESPVTIDLESSVDTFLYLRSGEARTGTVLHENDDRATGGGTDSRISETLAAGSYTIEATTFDAGTTGSFTLTVSGLGDGTTTEPTDPDPGETDSCGETLSGDGTSSGSWASGCESEVTGRGYAKYYAFSLAEESPVTIDLESSVDTFLYLRSGEARTGTVLHENDDRATGGGTDSRISETLAAGSYTIEATTFDAGDDGELHADGERAWATTATEPTDPDPGETDSCGETLSGDGTSSGSWASGCESEVTGRGYAKYYAFSLAEESPVTIDLESSVDTYLYLRSGAARTWNRPPRERRQGDGRWHGLADQRDAGGGELHDRGDDVRRWGRRGASR